MTKKEIVKECINLIDNGVGMVEIFEYIEENTDLDPAEIIDTIYRKQAFFN